MTLTWITWRVSTPPPSRGSGRSQNQSDIVITPSIEKLRSNSTCMPAPLFLRNQIKQQIREDLVAKTNTTALVQLEVELVKQYTIFKDTSRHVPTGFEDIIAKYHALLTKHKKEEHQLVIITGDQGSGKTCLMSHLARTCVDFLGKEKTITVLRYLGESTPSYDVSDLLLSISKQVSAATETPLDAKPAQSPAELKENFACLLEIMSKVKDSFLMVLDGLDCVQGLLAQSSDERAKRFDWMMSRLPSNCHIVVSFCKTGRSEDVLRTMIDKLYYNENVLSLPRVDDKRITQIMDHFAKELGRNISQEQKDLVRKATQATCSPLHLKLLVSQVLQGNSELPDNITSTVHQVRLFCYKCGRRKE